MPELKENNINKLEFFFLQYPVFHYKKKETILFTHDIPSGVFYITKGYVRSYIALKDGKEITISIHKPSDIFPLQWVMKDGYTQHYYQAIGNTEVRRAPKNKFLQLLTDDSQMLFILIAQLLTRLQSIEKQLAAVASGTAREKIIALLIFLAESVGKYQGKSVSLLIPLTHQDIATLLGLTRETISGEMQKLYTQGMLSKNGQRIIIPSIKKLRSQLVLS